MFKRISIELTEPICTCETNQLSWGITIGPGMYVECKECGTRVEVPNKKFMAAFDLDKKYPKWKCKECGELHETGLTHDQSVIKEIIE